MIYSDEMGQSQSVTTGYVAMTGSPYAPLKNGKLRKIELHADGDAVTTLIEGVMAKLTSPDWGVPITVMLDGGNLRTAPSQIIPMGITICDVPVTQSTKITIELKNITGGTPVTPRYTLVGTFEGG